jgi:aspartate aminotransferase
MSKRKNFDFQVNLNLNIRGLSPSATLAINELSNQLKKEGKEIVKLGLGQSPFPVPLPVVEALKNNAFHKEYLPVKGLPELKNAVAKFNFSTQKVNTNPEHVLVGPGSKELIFLLQLVYYGELIIPTPSWVSYAPQAAIIGRNVHWVQTSMENNLRLSPEKLEEICKQDPTRPRVVILNYPSNPTGCSYPIERLKLLAEVARKYKVILVSDEIYGLMHHNNQHVSVARFYPEGTIISNGLSKWCGAGGWRLGTFSFPPKLKWLLNAMAVVASETFTSTSAPIQYAAVKAFEGGAFIDDYLIKVRKILKVILKYISHRFVQLNITFPSPDGAFYIFPNFEFYRERLQKSNVYTSTELCRKLLMEKGVAMLPGTDFGRDPGEFSVRIAYVDFDGNKALEGCEEILNHENGIKEKEAFFIQQFAPKMVVAIDKISEWLDELPG